jgi:plasmid stabilization system protein ParE
MRLHYTTEALAHLEAINDFLTQRNPAAARRMTAEIQAAARRLCQFPQMGREEEAGGIRVWAVQRSPYLIVYEADHTRGEVIIVGVFHGAQDWEDRSK